MNSKKTISQVVAFVNAVKIYVERTKDLETKIHGHIRNIEKKQVPVIYEDYNDAVLEARRGNAATGDHGVLLREANGEYSYTADGERKRDLALKAASKKLYDITPRIAEGIEDVIASLTEWERECFAGFVIPEIEEGD